jgi:hypothetical protein
MLNFMASSAQAVTSGVTGLFGSTPEDEEKKVEEITEEVQRSQPGSKAGSKAASR